jgi:membrane-associated protease RseP (regulator of RpoE activity)
MDRDNFWGKGAVAGSSEQSPLSEHDTCATPSRKKPSIRVNIVLFILTIGTTILAGALQQGVNPLEHPEQIMTGVPFSFALLFILLSHEMGHYFVSKRHNIEATLPYFIPAPTFIGTFGAIIKMRSPVTNKKALLDVGAAGPLAGLIVTIPIIIIGLKLSEVHLVEASLEGGFTLGTSLLLEFLTRMIFGNLPENYQIIIHPLGFAGWIGLLITSLNLIPVGQLDGGHIAYAVCGRKTKIISRAVLIAMLGLGVWWSRMWLFWALILLVLLGTKHPPPVDFDSPLDTKRKVMGGLMLFIFIVTFIPVPFGGLE